MAWAEPAGKGRWRGRYRDQNGETKDAGYASTKKAQRLGRDEEAKIRQGIWFDPTAGTVTFSEYFENQWIVNRTFEASTRDYYWSLYRAGLKPQFGDVQLRRIRSSDAQAWVARMQRDGVTAATIRHRVKALQTVLAARKGASALRDKLIQFNPVAGVEPFVPEPDVEIYTPDETDALLAGMDPWWRMIPMFALETGCRWGEVMGVTSDDFSFGYKTVTIRRTIWSGRRQRPGTEPASCGPTTPRASNTGR